MAGSIRDHLTVAASVLKEVGATRYAEADRLREAGDSESAEAAGKRADEAYAGAAAVEAVIAPRGYLLLRDDQEKRESTSNLPVSMSEDLRNTLTAVAAEFGAVFAGMAEDAFRKVLEDGWIPPETPRGAAGTRGTKKNLNLKVDDSLRQQVRDMLPELSREAGYKISEANIVLSYICDELGVERAGAVSLERLETRVQRPLLEHFHVQAGAAGLAFQEIVEDGIRELLVGAWTPERHPYLADVASRPRAVQDRKMWVSASGREWSDSGLRARLSVPLDPELLASLRAKTDELSKELGFLVYPGSVVRQILTRRLGEPAE